MRTATTVERYQTGLRASIESNATINDIANGIDVSGFTSVPKISQFQATPQGRIVILMLRLDSQYTGKLRIDLQVSRTIGNWKSLGDDPWYGTEEYTRIPSMSYAHGPLPLDGDDESNPQPTTYYYRARIIRGVTDIIGPWSEPREVTVRPVSNADIMRNAITRLEMDAQFVDEFEAIENGMFPFGIERPSAISLNQQSIIGAGEYLVALEDRIMEADDSLEIANRRVTILTEEFTVLAEAVSTINVDGDYSIAERFAALELDVENITTTVGEVETNTDGNTSTISQTVQRVDSIETTLSQIDVGDGTAIDISSMQQSIDEIEAAVFTGDLDTNGDPIWRAGSVIEQLESQIASLVFDTTDIPEAWDTPIATMIQQEATRITQTVGVLTGDGEDINATGGLRGDVSDLTVSVEDNGTQLAQTIDYVRIAALATEMLTDELYETYQSAIDVTASKIAMIATSLSDYEQFSSQYSQVAEQISMRVKGRRWDESAGTWEDVPGAAMYLGVEKLPVSVSRSRYQQMEQVATQSLLERVYSNGSNATQDVDGYWSVYVVDVTASQEEQDALYGELRPHSLLVSQYAVDASEILLNGSVRAPQIDVDSLAASDAFINKLTATTAFIQNLEVETLGMRDKLIQEGFFDFIEAIEATFTDVQILGKSFFEGSIDSGPLLLSNDLSESSVPATNVRADTLRAQIIDDISSAWHPIKTMDFVDYTGTTRSNVSLARTTYSDVRGDYFSEASSHTWDVMYYESVGLNMDDIESFSSCDDSEWIDEKKWAVYGRQSDGTQRVIAQREIKRVWGCIDHYYVITDTVSRFGSTTYYYQLWRTYGVSSDWHTIIDRRAQSCTITFSGLTFRVRGMLSGPGSGAGDLYVDGDGYLKATIGDGLWR